MDINDFLKSPWYVKLLAFAARCLRKAHLGKVVLNVREKIILETVFRLHLDGIHLIRRFSVNDHFLGVLGNQDNPSEPFEDLADGIRDVLAKTIAVDCRALHCTIKTLQGSDGTPKEDWQVYTLARSTPCERPAEFHPTYHLVGRNSSFAALVGCNDLSNTWLPNAHVCFGCNDLWVQDKYECTRKDWKRYFRSTVVFPLRYRKIQQQDHKIVGFLTFDCKSAKVFGNIPNIFDFKDEPVEYNKRLQGSSVYHVGGMVADILAATIYLQEEKIRGVETGNGQREN
jgi:hypothetical protein